jgi:hypothetical protein
MQYDLEFLNKIIESATYLYRTDKMAPNVLISKLPKNNSYYLSINRYNKEGSKEKQIIFKTYQPNLEDVLKDAAIFLTEQVVNENPVDELTYMLGECLEDDGERDNCFDDDCCDEDDEWEESPL